MNSTALLETPAERLVLHYTCLVSCPTYGGFLMDRPCSSAKNDDHCARAVPQV